MPELCHNESKGLDLFITRLDGSMSQRERSSVIAEFQDPSPKSPRVLLLSLKAGGVGLNLTAANRLLLIDPAWNPATEDQCFDRIHRLGQVKGQFASILRDQNLSLSPK